MPPDRLFCRQILIVIPTYNERESITEPAAAITALNEAFVVLVVDDSSPDGTGSLIQGLGRENPRVRLLSRPAKQRLGSAYIAGFRFALRYGFARVVTMDADFSHDPAALESLVKAAVEWEVVIGSRYVEGGRITHWSWCRRQLSSTANRLARRLLGPGIRDWTSGYRCYRRQVLEQLPFEALRANGYSFLVEVLAACVRLGCRVTEVPITFSNRRAGHSKLSRREISKGVLEDQVREGMAALGILSGRDFPLVEPQAALSTLNLVGLLYYYLLAPLYEVSPNPVVGIALVNGLNLGSVYPMYRLGAVMFGPPVGLVAAALYAVFPMAVLSGKALWNTGFSPFFSTFFYGRSGACSWGVDRGSSPWGSFCSACCCRSI